MAGNATNEAAKPVRKKILKLEDGGARVADVPSTSISLGELANMANPMRGGVKPGAEHGLEATNYFGPERGATASGIHVMIVEVNPETMQVHIQKYLVVHDCGKVINPLILDGQIHGGVAQGIGNAFYERLAYDENGQLLNGTFMDYHLCPPAQMCTTELDTPSVCYPTCLIFLLSTGTKIGRLTVVIGDWRLARNCVLNYREIIE